MAKTDNLTDFLTDLADAIRAKKGTTALINPQDFSSEIANLQTDVTPVLNELTVTPTTEDVVKTPSEGVDGFSKITVKAVNSSIDSNIIAGNIKKDITILGVTGTLEGGGSGGSGESSDSGGEYLVRVIDYNGTILKQDHLNKGATFTLPNAPTNHERLVFQEWSSPVDITDNTITVGNSDITIGAVYTTKSGLSEFNITLTKVTGLAVTLNMDGTKDWGDGTSDTATTHTYTNYGDYMITCDGTTMTTSSSSGLFGQSSSNINYYVKSVNFANITGFTKIDSYAFAYCYSLTSVTIPNGVTEINAYIFRQSYSLTSITIPNSVTSLIKATYFFMNCYSLLNIAIPKGLTIFGSSTFSGCYSLASITIPNGVTSISSSLFYNCYSLTNITIPNSVTDIGSNSSLSCRSIIKYDFTLCTEIKPLNDTNAFKNINAACKIYVPDALYDEWIVATNWATYADYIYKASEMPTGE